MAPEAFALSELVDKMRRHIPEMNRLLSEFKDLPAERRQSILALRNRMCELEPKLVQLLLEHA